MLDVYAQLQSQNQNFLINFIANLYEEWISPSPASFPLIHLC